MDSREAMAYSAEKDAEVVRVLRAADADYHCEAICYHAQQAAEKMVKAALFDMGVVPPRTHKVDDLLALAEKKGGTTVGEEVMRAAEALSFYESLARYGEAHDVARGDAVHAVECCDAIGAFLEENGFEAVLIGRPDTGRRPPRIDDIERGAIAAASACRGAKQPVRSPGAERGAPLA